MQAHNQKKSFQGRGCFLKLGHFHKHFLKKSRKKNPAAENFGAFCPTYSQNYILNGKFNLRIDKIRAFFPKPRHFFFNFRNSEKEGLPLSPYFCTWK